MADSSVPITAGSGTNVDTRTTTGGDHKQVMVPAGETDAEVAKFVNTTPGASDYGLVTRPAGGTAGTPAGSVLSVQGVGSGTNLPVALGAALPAGTNNIGDVDVLSLPALVAGSANIGHVDGQGTAGTPAGGVVSVQGVVGGQFIPVGAFASGVLTKGTQLVNGFMVQRIHDAGRNPVHYFSNVAVAGASAEALLSLTGTKSGAAVGATTTPAVVTAGKVLRLQRFAATFVASATSVYAVFKLRYNIGGVVVVGSPILATLIIGAGTPATANSSNSQEATIADGLEIPAGAGIGITAQTFNGTTATNGGFVAASVLGFEY